MRFTSLFLQASTLHTTHPACIYMIHTTHPACFTPLDLEAVFASHHSSCELHTTRPASLHASHHTACELHTTRPSSMDASHHTSCKPKSFTPHVLQACMLHTTHHASFTPHILEADLAAHHTSCKPNMLHTTHPASLHASQHSGYKGCVRDGVVQIWLLFFVFATQFPRNSLQVSSHSVRITELLLMASDVM